MAKILIFEDNIDLSLYWQRLLESQAHSVQCCDSVAAALAIVETMKPDLVIADMLIKSGEATRPEGGLTLISKLQMLGPKRLRILGVSGMKPNIYLKSTALEIAENMGIDMALYKPLSAEQLLESVHYLLEL